MLPESYFTKTCKTEEAATWNCSFLFWRAKTLYGQRTGECMLVGRCEAGWEKWDRGEGERTHDNSMAAQSPSERELFNNILQKGYCFKTTIKEMKGSSRSAPPDIFSIFKTTQLQKRL